MGTWFRVGYRGGEGEDKLKDRDVGVSPDE